MTKDGPIECYCGDDADEGFMLNCERCKHWQHGQCVNLNPWTEQAKYVCPSCLGLEINCPCEFEGDYQRALIQCSKCHLYQHKRHVGYGVGKNPDYYLCSECSPNFQGGRSVKVDPVMGFFPTFSDMFVPPSLTDLEISIPNGRLLNKFREFNKPISPVTLIAQIYEGFRDNFFKSHPFMAYFKSGKSGPKDYVEDCSTFIVYVYAVVGAMTNLSYAQITQVIDHVITLDIYKRPLSPAIREPVTDIRPARKRTADSELVIGITDRAKYALEPMKFPKVNATVSTRLSLVAGKNGFPTVIADSDLRCGEMICECYGYLSMMEEADCRSQVPDLNMYNIFDTELVLNSQKLSFSPMYLRIRRGFAYNCEVRIFKTGTEHRVGIFACEMNVMLTMTRKDKKWKQLSNVVIAAGDELVLPFDITPICVKTDSEWRNRKDEKLKIDPHDFAPARPSPYQTGDLELHMETHSSQSNVEKQSETTLQNLFGEETFGTFVLESGRRDEDTDRRVNLPSHLVDLPVLGKKSWHVPMPFTQEMKPFQRYNRTAWVDPPTPLDVSCKPPLRAADFWDADSPDDWIRMKEADMLKH